MNESEEVFDLTTRLLLSFKLVKDPSLIIFSFDANIEGKLVLQPNMDENKLHFLIKSAEFSDLAIMVPCGELDTEELANIFNILLNTGIYIVNGKFLENGITLPSAYGVSIEKINLKITGDYVEIGLVPKFQ